MNIAQLHTLVGGSSAREDEIEEACKYLIKWGDLPPLVHAEVAYLCAEALTYSIERPCKGAMLVVNLGQLVAEARARFTGERDDLLEDFDERHAAIRRHCSTGEWTTDPFLSLQQVSHISFIESELRRVHDRLYSAGLISTPRR